MGTTSHIRVPHRPCKQPHSVKSALTNPASIGPESCSYTGGLKVAGQRGYCPGNSKPYGLYLTAFSHPQKGWGLRPVLNLKALNRFIQWEHFQMEGLHMLPDILMPNDWMVKLDLKDAYLQVPIHQAHHQFLKFQWEGRMYYFQCLPFGLSSMPRVFTKIMRPVVGFLRQAGIQLLIYLDDMLILHQEKTILQQLVGIVIQFFQSLALIVNREKSVLDPTQALEFLGFTIRTLPMTIHLPKEKLRKIKQEAQTLLAQEMVTIKDLASFIGKISASSRAIRIAPLHYRSLQKMVNSVVPYHYSNNEIRRKYSMSLPLTPEAQDDLQWWTNQLKQFNTAPIQSPTPNLIIESDASNMGWGAACQGARTGGLWSKQEALHHINYLELLAEFLALKSFTKGKRDLSILLKMDSITALTYVNKMGGPHSYLQCSLALTMWNWCLQRHFWIKAEHLPGMLNRAADTESQIVKDRCDWMLNPQIFTQLRSVMGTLHVDLFASRLTHQLPQFFSWRPDPEAEAVDAFTQDWSQIWGYANPPWCLISRCLTHIKCQQTRVLPIAPLWRTQSWIPVLLEMLEDYPRILPERPDLTLQPTGQEFIMNQVPTLVAWPICGIPSSQEAFWNQHRSSYCHPGDPRQHPKEKLRKMKHEL